MKTLVDAVTKFQALWRAYCARNEVAILKMKMKKRRKHKKKGKKGSKSPGRKSSAMKKKK